MLNKQCSVSKAQQVHTIHLCIHTVSEDYTALENRLLEFGSSTRPQVVTILIEDDEVPEPSESFTVRLELQTEDSNVLLIPNEAVITINDNDSMLFAVTLKLVEHSFSVSLRSCLLIDHPLTGCGCFLCI